MFIETEATPNPDVLKFLPGREVSPGAAHDYRSAEDAAESPLASALFSHDFVKAVFLGPDFVAITRDGGQEWEMIRALILGTIMEHFQSGAPVVQSGEAGGHAGDEDYDGEAAEIVTQIKELLDTRVRPAVARDGGDIVFQRFDTKSGAVYLHMRGACAGCPSSTMTLKHGIENLLKHYVPEVSSVEEAV